VYCGNCGVRCFSTRGEFEVGEVEVPKAIAEGMEGSRSWNPGSKRDSDGEGVETEGVVEAGVLRWVMLER